MLDNETFASRANERFEKAREFWHNWRSEARDDYAFVSGKQWKTEDENILLAEKRPPITFNYSEKMIDAVVGAEVNNRQEVHYTPRGLEDAQLAELWNSAAQWARQSCNAEDEESDAFRDALICGMGWTWTRISYDEDLDGQILIERIDPLDMYVDPAATKVGLLDRRYHDRLWWVDETEVRRQWPDAIFPTEGGSGGNSGVITAGHRYRDEGFADNQDAHKGQVQLRLHECVELEDVYRVAGPNGLQEIPEADFRKIKSQIPEGQFVKQRKKVYYRAFFAGDTLLEVKKSPCQAGFCMQVITGKRDRNANTWYGLTRVMKDPQRWANKWLSQILHIINSNAKGGLLAEAGAFMDPVKAREEWAMPNTVTELREGGIDKIRERQATAYPSGLDKLMGFALESLPMVTGINLEALGLANRDQANVLETQRKQAAYGLLAGIFDSLRRYRKNSGRVLLDYIHNYISDGRLVRIGGPDSQQFLPLTKSADAPRYDIIVDQAPNAPDAKQHTWQALTEILPAMLKAGIPLPPDLLDYTPLPTPLVTKWKEFIGQQQQHGQQQQQEMQKMQQENQDLKSQKDLKMQEFQFEQQKAAAEMGMEQQKMQTDMQLNQQKMQAQIQLDREKAKATFELEAFKQDRQHELEQRRLQHESQMKQSQLDNDFKVKAFTAGATADEAGKFQISLDTGGLPELLNKFAQASTAMTQQAQASNQMITDAVTQLAATLGKPRKLTLDAAGRPIGSTIN